MATKTGASGIIKFSAIGGSEVAIAAVRSFTYDGSADTIESTFMGNSVRTYLPSLTTNTLSVDVYWDEADPTQLLLDEGFSCLVEVFPTGGGSGETFFSGNGIVTSKSITGSFDGMVEASFTVQFNGAVTESQV